MFPVTLHVSVWVEMTFTILVKIRCVRHAPRERVSWNKTRTVNNLIAEGHAPRERVSWNLKPLTTSVKVYESRSTWACELKFDNDPSTAIVMKVTLHVSVWVEIQSEETTSLSATVTLHVSVWVEMLGLRGQVGTCTSRSTWACELKFL